ncbi:MAG: GGDEF domain-containing protein [Clostridia bacterium]|nr:GGDEF domain-containing protein [Clostridia bacterium]MBR5544244.1 GGDEF domain-containing protein [Clostridia bacterium]
MFKNIISEITKIKNIEQSKISEAYEAKKAKNSDNPIYREVEADRVHTNFIRIIPASIALLIVEICGMVWSLWTEVKFDFGPGFLISCCVFAFVSVCFIVAIEFLLKYKKTSNQQMKVIYTAYWVLYTIEALSFSVMEALDRQTTNNYLIFVLLISILPVITPFTKNLMLIVALYVECCSLLFAMARPIDLMICFFVTLMGMGYSVVHFNHYLSVSIANKKLEFSANGDLLTSFMNRRGLEKAAPMLRSFCKNNGYEFCLIMIDIDNFKSYNDRYGHLEGDVCLKTVSACVKENFSRPTDLCVRYGGEEFLVLTAQRDVEKLVEHLEDTLELVNDIELENTYESVSISAGLYVATEEDADVPIEKLVERADKQLYNAKKRGKNCVSYKDEIY